MNYYLILFIIICYFSLIEFIDYIYNNLLFILLEKNIINEDEYINMNLYLYLFYIILFFIKRKILINFKKFLLILLLLF